MKTEIKGLYYRAQQNCWLGSIQINKKKFNFTSKDRLKVEAWIKKIRSENGSKSH